jgi:hypothetical protein
MIGPLLMFDKSFLEMLNPAEVSELSMHFKFVGTPTLIGEIIADLKLPPDERRVPADVVKLLSKKMQTVHGLQPANYRKLALANVYAHQVSMIGQVTVDASAPNVHVTADRQGLYYDSTPEQRLWERWASGEFNTEDELTATTWRKGIEEIEPEKVAAHWKPFTAKHFSMAKNQNELITAINVLLKDSTPAVQREILEMALELLKASAQECLVARVLMTTGGVRSLVEFAPYAASVIRLFLAFACGLARGFIGPRPTNYIDLQYLYYSPFCMVFVSNDKFHREMWPATAGAHSFLWGQDVKNDLRRRIAIRGNAAAAQASTTPDSGCPVEGPPSVIADMWRIYMRPTDKSHQHKRADTFEDLDPEIQQQLKDAMRYFDRREEPGGSQTPPVAPKRTS